MSNFKDIHMGDLIKIRLKELIIDDERIENYFQMSSSQLNEMLMQKSIDSFLLLKWSKLLNYDFFRLYSHHLLLYSPSSNMIKSKVIEQESLPRFRKHIYSKEIIDFILELIHSNKKTKKQIIEEYNIPKTTLYKWLSKYKQN